jgi:hypothetical protein
MKELTRKQIIKSCSPKWDKGMIRLDSVIHIMGECARILLIALDERIKDEDEVSNKITVDTGGDDTHFDYNPCALRNIQNVITMYLAHGIEGDGEAEIKDSKTLTGEEIWFQGGESWDKDDIARYRYYSEMAGADWADWDKFDKETSTPNTMPLGEEPKN